MSFLVFQLKAPLASFGDSMGEFRGTALRPRKSAVLGLVAAALGIERTETARFKELFQVFQFAAAEVKAPSVMQDFHTVEAPSKVFARTRQVQLAQGETNTILAPRDYLQDGHWLVALFGPDAYLLAVKAALEAPRFPLYLGRKACPLSAFTAPQLVPDASCVSEAFVQWAKQEAEPLRAGPIAVAWEPGVPCKLRARVSRRVGDVRQSLTAPFFTSREELEGSFEGSKAP